MRIIRWLLIVTLIASTALSSVSAADNQRYTIYVTDVFSDVSPSDWFAGSVQRAYTMKLMKGTSKTAFEPQSGMTRAMFAQALYSIDEQSEEDDERPDRDRREKKERKRRTLPFTDVSQDQWFYPAVFWAYQEKITSGISEEHFGPFINITREQAVQLLYAFSGEPRITDDHTLEDFADADAVDGWAEDAFLWAVQKGILSGSADGGRLYLNPHTDLKRSEAAELLTFYCSCQYGMTASPELPEEITVQKSSIRNGVRVPALMYHEVSDKAWGLDYLFVPTGQMREQLKWLQDNGYQTVFFSDLANLRDYRKPVLLTFDDGYEGNYENLFPLLKEFNMKATIFVVTDEIGDQYRMTANQLREMSESGLVSIQSHTKSHKRLDLLSESQLTEECLESRAVISGITGKSPYALSYPEGKYSDLSLSVISRYYSFGVLDRHGSWISNQDTLYQICRTVIPREYTIQQFAAAVSR